MKTRLLLLSVLISLSFAIKREQGNPLAQIWVPIRCPEGSIIYKAQSKFDPKKSGIHIKANGVLKMRCEVYSMCATTPAYGIRKGSWEQENDSTVMFRVRQSRFETSVTTYRIVHLETDFLELKLLDSWTELPPVY